jgi:hypothetical protein
MALLASSPAQAVTFYVDSEIDEVDALPGDGVCATLTGGCTLRPAIQEANALPGEDASEVPAGNYVLAIPGIDEDLAAAGDLDILGDLILTGSGMDETVIDAAGLDRVLEIQNVDLRQPVELSGLTILVGDTALVASSLAGLRIVDVSNPAVSVEVGTSTLRTVRMASPWWTGSPSWPTEPPACGSSTFSDPALPTKLGSQDTLAVFKVDVAGSLQL